MSATITNCYIGGAGTSAIAQRVFALASPSLSAPSDFFSRELFNNSGLGISETRLKSKISKVGLLKLLHGRNSSTDGGHDMERSVAIKKLGKLVGKSLGYRVDNRAPSKDERDAAQAELPAAIAARNKLKDAKEARFQEILASDHEYMRLRAEHKNASEQVERLSSITRHRKITVGKSNDIFFHVLAEGDSWEEVIGKLEARSAA